ncbi:MAG: sulfite exporter TauE/SafE family protein, partial [Planctomycetota bacterium]
MIAAAVLSASVLGSLHCAGMCGPLAMWASGMERQHKRWKTQTATGLYHFGRLATYSLVGAVAGSIGGMLDASGQVLGVQLMAAKIVGGFMVVVGLREVWKQLHLRFPEFMQRFWPHRSQRGRLVHPSGAPTTTSNSRSLAGFLAKLRPQIFALPLPLRGLFTGLLTALLPCGWLY